MRQRFLLGVHNRKRYFDEYKLLDPESATEEVLMMSTIYNRTIQSGFSELMGMFPPTASDAVKLTKA